MTSSSGTIPQPTGPLAIDLELLEHRVRIESTDRQVLDNLARCCDVALDGASGNHQPGSICGSASHPRPALPQRSRPRRASTSPATRPPAALRGYRSLRVDRATPLISALNLWAVGEARRHYVFHAGAVARDGRAILLPTNSHSGKSTLTAALLGRGFSLLSDEVGADRGRQRPAGALFPSPLAAAPVARRPRTGRVPGSGPLRWPAGGRRRRARRPPRRGPPYPRR